MVFSKKSYIRMFHYLEGFWNYYTLILLSIPFAIIKKSNLSDPCPDRSISSADTIDRRIGRICPRHNRQKIDM